MNFSKLEKTFVIAEVGVNHEGDAAVAEDLVRKAAAAGADAVKFQTFTAKHYVSTVQPDRRARVERFTLSHDAFRRIAQVAKESGIMFFSTPLHHTDVDFLDEVAPIFKISSGDLTFLELIEHTAKKRKPMIISTGLGTRDEIARAVATVEKAAPDVRDRGGLLLMHCVSAYPTPPEEANLANLRWLSKEFGYPVGYSDHTLGIKACELAVAVGAVALEKHFTYRREGQVFHDHALSAEPQELAQLIANVRDAEKYLGSPVRSRGPSEEKMVAHMRRSIGAALDIAEGALITADAITWLRPAWGLSADAAGLVIGKRARRNIAAGELIKEEDFYA